MLFVSKRKYQEKLELIEAYKEKCKEKDLVIYRLKNDKGNLEDVIKLLEKQLNVLNNTVESCEKINSDLLREQTKLIEWIEKVINDLGCYEVSSNNTVRIPMIQNCRNYDDVGWLNGKEVRIPEIVYFKTTKRGE